ncbi:hypothetical protein Hrd1104_00080 [Halorhabdus sp. CBA1104]|uniref:hypothetical protein n=1 Tax=Halorhabdus sp. CBA1104 TaxID=1380432 RepID=UPI0012B22213|nr:hypothetical protein [Halorhabdus sp. CBA1104]QGN05843.1 hypothetical protein Hrd1104_00080 [Halorhabdus sp. CBA1104]
MITDDKPLIQLLAVLLAGVGSLNWGLVEFADLDLLVEVGLTGDMLGYAYLLVGIAGAIVLIDMADLVQDGGIEGAEPLED